MAPNSYATDILNIRCPNNKENVLEENIVSDDSDNDHEISEPEADTEQRFDKVEQEIPIISLLLRKDKLENFATSYKDNMVNEARYYSNKYHRQALFEIIQLFFLLIDLKYVWYQECYRRYGNSEVLTDKYDSSHQVVECLSEFKNIIKRFSQSFSVLRDTNAKRSPHVTPNASEDDPFFPAPNYKLPENITKHLANTKKYFATDDTGSDDTDLDNSKDEDDQKATIDFCLSCKNDRDKVTLVQEHPLFKGHICSECQDEMLQCITIQHYDDVYAYCAICFEGGSMFVCSKQKCLRSYCVKCLKSLIDQTPDFKQIEENDDWICFLCSQTTLGLLQPRNEWRENLLNLFMPKKPNMELIDKSHFTVLHPIRVLSLFDGISSGRYALEQLGFDIDKYFASEIDKDAILISTIHGNSQTIYLGDVTKMTEKTIEELCPIDLYIGGSPCNDLALVNHMRKGLWDGTGQLFFEYYRILNLIRRFNRNKSGDVIPFFWLYENVLKMEIKTRDTISRFLECDPVAINAAMFSPQNRTRYFWGNVPGLYRNWDNKLLELQHDPNSEFLKASHVITPRTGRTASNLKVNSITTNRNSVQKSALCTTNLECVSQEDNLLKCPVYDNLWINEIEKIFGFPEHFTDYCNLSPIRRQKLLGKAWSIPVIIHILSPLKRFFSSICTKEI
ncbi:DNA (cytosine-5)-methyltransferase 3B-like [Gordionus sp. m RMFG-2023]|uniref:DNA (cytosine-5)-methyltransferase 3B-like n=1 Tax=Gordionus sp. m RMFG-2023 TaxID=3053472 RepID=UPI0031FD72A1